MRSFISKSILTLSITLLLSACGGGGGGSSDGSNQGGNSNNQSQSNQTNGTGNSTEGNQTSNSTVDKFGYDCSLTVVNTFTLPPCPNQELSDSTLLGIDNNDNGVRDDVERWLVMKYKDHHPIATEIGFQGARAHQFMLANQNEWGHKGEANKRIEAAQNCNSYFSLYANRYNEYNVIDHDIITEKKLYRAVQFNTNPRIRAYLNYDQSLSGGAYSLPKISQLRSYCNFDINQSLQDNPAENYPQYEWDTINEFQRVN